MDISPEIAKENILHLYRLVMPQTRNPALQRTPSSIPLNAARYGMNENGYAYNDDYAYSPSHSSDSSESENEQNGIMYLEPTTSYKHLKA